MTLKVRMVAAGSNEELHYEENPFSKNGPVMITMSPAQYHGHFKVATRTTMGTTVIVSPKPGRSLVVTDILISGEKQAGSSVTVQFTDGVDTEIMVLSDQVDATPTMSGNLNSYFYGWKDARVALAGTLITGVNLNFASGNVAEADARGDETTNSSQGSIVLQSEMEAAKMLKVDWEGALILGTNDSYAIDFPTEPAIVYATVFGYFEDKASV